MSESSTIEQRLAQVEKEVSFLKSRFNEIRSKDHWIDQVKGSFEGDPEFDKILELGQQIRQADQPEAK